MLKEVVDEVTGEVIEETAIVVANTQRDDMLAMIKDVDKPVFNALAGMQSLDWKNLAPPHMALLLMAKPFAVSGGGVMNLNFRQAMLFAVRAYELGLSPFSDNLWFDPARGSVNITMSGKRELARLRNIDMGPPMFEEVYREWVEVPKITSAGDDAKKIGFSKDCGVKCTIRVGDPKNNEKVSYTAWLNDWYQPRSPVWKEKYQHMLTIRANEKALTLILGTGASQMLDEKEVE